MKGVKVAPMGDHSPLSRGQLGDRAICVSDDLLLLYNVK